MRNTLYKGISIHDGTEVYGYYYYCPWNNYKHWIRIIKDQHFQDFAVKNIGEFVCNDKNKNRVWSNSKVKYNNGIYSLIYNVKGWYINDGILSNFDENEIEVVID